VNHVRIQGLELEAGFHRGKWRSSAALSLVDAKDRESGKVLQNRPGEFLRMDLDRQSGAHSIGASLIAQGPSYNDPGNTVRLAGYTLLNLRASWQLKPQWTVRASIENAADIDYVTIRSTTGENYRQAGRAGYLSIHFHQ
jgi:vitamin B12 transporter